MQKNINVRSMPLWASFIEALSLYLHKDSVLQNIPLYEYTILLPNQRSCRKLQEYLLKYANHDALILPKIQSLGEIDPEEAGDEVDAINPMVRQGMLMSLLLKSKALVHEIHPAQAALLASDLGRLMDQVEWEGLDFSRLESLVTAEYAEHWGVTLDFLKVITHHWPLILADMKLKNPAKAKYDNIARMQESLKNNPPQGPIIAAGSTGSIPVVANLLKAIAHLPQGQVILPGLDYHLSEALWSQLEITHPQYGLAKLLELFEITRSDVVELEVETPIHCKDRVEVCSKMLQPSYGQDWNMQEETLKSALQDLKLIECSSPQEEAMVVALNCRAALENQNATVAVITSDRSLVRRINAQLRRWNLVADDSAGEPFLQTHEGRFVQQVAEFCAEPKSSVSLLAMLKSCNIECTEYELKLRGKEPVDLPISCDISPFSNTSSFLELVNAHKGLACSLMPDLDTPEIWEELLKASSYFPDIQGQDYPQVFASLLAKKSQRQPTGHHPRLTILGTVEARMQKADYVIMAGLNENSWPPRVDVDPWLNRPMRSEFGLPLPERRIGLSSHDFAGSFCANHVIMTRSMRVDGSPTIPSRWLERFNAVLKANEVLHTLDKGDKWLVWAAQLDIPNHVMAIERPMPKPPLAARPQKLSVTQIETLMRDPYALYASKILKLKPLDPLEAPLAANVWGSLLHEILDKYIQQVRNRDDPLQCLLEIAEEVFATEPEVGLFSRIRFKRIAKWFVSFDLPKQEEILRSLTEITGFITLPCGFTITAKADRIDVFDDNSVEIIDYKTGVLPSIMDLKTGYACQMLLEGAILKQGGFPNIDSQKMKRLLYIRLTGGTPVGEILKIDDNLDQMIENALQNVTELVNLFANPETPYAPEPNPYKALLYNDYAHLSRIAEWGQVA